MIYVILNSSDLSLVNFTEIGETSANTLRYSVDGSKFIVKFEGDTPFFLDGKTQYTHSEIITVLAGEEWTSPDGP